MTAETALALPALALVLAAVLGTGRVVLAQVSCADAARAGARAAARAEPDSTVHDVAARLAPSGSSIQVGRAGSMVRVEVSAAVPFLRPAPAVAIRCLATGVAETP